MSSPGSPTASPSPAAASAEPSAASTTLWLCRPGLPDNPCEDGLDATLVDGSNAVEPFEPAADPEIDCFYVYPTVSRATAMNAPMAVDDSLLAVVRAQAARFGEVCRVFAPVYRQITVSGIFTGHYEDTAARAMAERDVALAWEDYLARDNDGRGVVLLGHSQGARTLTALLQAIERKPEQRERLVSALLLGGDVTVATGSDVGGSFTRTPACQDADQTGCVVAYSAFAAAPPADALFGVAKQPDQQVLCVDPSRLISRGGELDPYLPTATLGPAGALDASVPGVQTAFAAYPGQLRSDCRVENGVSHLRVGLAPGARIAAPSGALGPRWGLHSGDVNLALGSLVELVRQQAEAYSAS